jgi:uncharacterized protein (DUF58 family)
MMAVPLLSATALYSLTVLTGNVWFTLLAGVSVGLLVGALVWRPRLDGLELCLAGPGRAAVGERVVHTVHVHNHSERQLPGLELSVLTRGLPGLIVYVEPLPPGSRAVMELSRVAISRGVTDIVQMLMVATTGLGMMRTYSGGDYASRLVIHPRAVGVGPLEQRSSHDDQSDLVPGPGMDIAGVREWRPGDASSSVHWRSTARRGTLVVRERAIASTRQVVVALACSSAAADWEDVLAAAAGACKAAQLAGQQLTLWVWGDGEVLAVPPVHSVTALLDWWAGLPASCLPAPATLARAVTSTGSADVHVAASATTPETWWDEVRQGAGRSGGSMHRLRVTA